MKQSSEERYQFREWGGIAVMTMLIGLAILGLVKLMDTTLMDTTIDPVQARCPECYINKQSPDYLSEENLPLFIEELEEQWQNEELSYNDDLIDYIDTQYRKNNIKDLKYQVWYSYYSERTSETITKNATYSILQLRKEFPELQMKAKNLFGMLYFNNHAWFYFTDSTMTKYEPEYGSTREVLINKVGFQLIQKKVKDYLKRSPFIPLGDKILVAIPKVYDYTCIHEGGNLKAYFGLKCEAEHQFAEDGKQESFLTVPLNKGIPISVEKNSTKTTKVFKLLCSARSIEELRYIAVYFKKEPFWEEPVRLIEAE